jgi:hypothetical protein
VSAVTPNQAYLGRTVDLTIAGSGTSWSDKTTVAFSDPQVKVNKVTVASITGLVANVTIGAGAALGADDITVSDGGTTETYKGAFQILEPIKVTTDQMGNGVPQGGYADIHVDMLDITTPFDASTTTLTVSNQNLAVSAPQVGGDYGLDFLVQADVLEKAGTVDLVVTSNGVDSPLSKAFSVVARSPIMLMAGMQAKGHLENLDDTGLYQYAAADTSLRFVQLQVSNDATAGGAILPKSGKWSDAGVGFVGPYGVASTSTDLNYLVVGDSAILLGNPFGGAVPYDFTVTLNDTKVTGVQWAAGNTSPAAALAVTTLPGLVQNADLNTPGSMGATQDQHWYKITVAGASAASPKKIHVATGGDAFTATQIDVFTAADAMTMPLPMPMQQNTSGDNGGQEDLVVPAITTDGDYYIHVYASAFSFSSMDSGLRHG